MRHAEASHRGPAYQADAAIAGRRRAMAAECRACGQIMRGGRRGRGVVC